MSDILEWASICWHTSLEELAIGTAGKRELKESVMFARLEDSSDLFLYIDYFAYNFQLETFQIHWIKHNHYRNNYPERITSAPINLDRRKTHHSMSALCQRTSRKDPKDM